MDLILKMIDSTNTFLWSYILIVMLISLGIYFTLRTKFVQFRYFGEMFRLLGDGRSKDAKIKVKFLRFKLFVWVQHQELELETIAGIAIAIVAGGPGAIFWMWIIALIGSASSFVESTLAQIYKVKDDNGIYRWSSLLYGTRIK